MGRIKRNIMTEIELTPFEISFYAELDNIPDEYIELLLPPYDEEKIIPCKERKIGDLYVKIVPSRILVKVGEHTNVQFLSPSHAVNFIRDVLTDDLVFHFHDGEVDHYRFEEFLSLSDTDWNFYVWSGPFRYAFIEKNRP